MSVPTLERCLNKRGWSKIALTVDKQLFFGSIFSAQLVAGCAGEGHLMVLHSDISQSDGEVIPQVLNVYTLELGLC